MSWEQRKRALSIIFNQIEGLIDDFTRIQLDEKRQVTLIIYGEQLK